MNDPHHDTAGEPFRREAWRTLDELADGEAFRAKLAREFGEGVIVPGDAMSRRRFFELMAASLALAGIGACARPPGEEVVPYVRMPEHGVPGEVVEFATATLFAGFAKGALVESREGRPIKVEGNPLHPATLGASDPFMQAAILDLYDPGRSQVLLRKGRIGTWASLLGEVGVALRALEAAGGEGLHVLTGGVTSPTVAGLMTRLRETHPRATWHRHEPFLRQNARAGARIAFGEDVVPVHRFDRAKVIVAIDGDFLSCPIAGIRHARDFAATRRPYDGGMSRLYAIESTPSLAGAAADHRLAASSAAIDRILRALARSAGMSVAGLRDEDAVPVPDAVFVEAAGRDLARHRGAGLVTVGDGQPPHVHALAHAINHALGNAGRTVAFIEPVEVTPSEEDGLLALAEAARGGAVQALVILGSNPVYTSPPALEFGELLQRVPLSVHHGLEVNETAARCTWHVPAAHELESWGDACAYDGTATILQPLIAPLYGGRSELDLLAAMLGDHAASSYDLVRETWKARSGGGDFEDFWRRSVHDGVVAGTESAVCEVSVKDWSLPPLPAAGADAGAIEVVFRPHPRVWDGRFSTNAWLQELPAPLTKLTWQNAVEVSPVLAAELELRDGDVVELTSGAGSVAGAAMILPGQAPRSVTVHAGYGRGEAGRVAAAAGFDAFALWPAAAPPFFAGAGLRKTAAWMALPESQIHQSMEWRDLLRERTISEVPRPGRSEGDRGRHDGHDGDDHPTLYRREPAGEHAWGMAIDLATCIGCGACTAACQAENNIPVVGREEVIRGRIMHWIRVDRYFLGPPEDPSAAFQPVPCMHCEAAPCEPVCPVGATTHGNGGLNQMVYNRCVGTRYCSNNCPYKVRRFNFYDYSDREAVVMLARNPEVTVRARGVMEKCTYCVQRINAGQVAARTEGRPLRDGEIVTACQQACPTQAIVFGDLHDRDSAVSKAKALPLDYVLLSELNTRPRTSYSERVRNPNPELEG